MPPEALRRAVGLPVSCVGGGNRQLGRKSEQIRYEGHTDTAVELAQAAQAGEGSLAPAVRARAADFEARAWALKGKRGKPS